MPYSALITVPPEEALTMSDKIVVLSEGRIQQIGTPEDIYNEPQNAFVADFIGESNIFKGIRTGPAERNGLSGQVDDARFQLPHLMLVPEPVVYKRTAESFLPVRQP